MKKIGLALGGGAAHGVAHFGIIQVLLENNIPIDYISGCSAGAIAGGMYASGSDMYMAAKLCTSINMSSFIDITIPKMGFIKGDKAENLVALLTKNMNIEDCSVPFCTVACDIISGKCITISSGKIASACHASFAIPGIFEPVEKDGMQLVDGGAMTRVPIGQVRDMGADYVIAVDVGYQGWGHKKAKNMMELLMSAFDLCDWQVVEQMYRLADCVIRPDLRDIPTDSLEKARECIEIGRNAALEILPSIKRDLDL